jgi:type VI secretion system secreted protein VgrG
VGPAGDEIYTDKFGRVKVQFDWDRLGRHDEKSSCWVRVAQVWAGKQWGAMHIPRIGHEVMVEFLDGDPDRPIITGRVYNADNMPPYALPDNKTQSGIKSRSSKGGAAEQLQRAALRRSQGQRRSLSPGRERT